MQQQLGVLGTISAFTFRHRETKKNLCRGGRSQDLPDTDFQPAIRQLKFCSLSLLSLLFQQKVMWDIAMPTLYVLSQTIIEVPAYIHEHVLDRPVLQNLEAVSLLRSNVSGFLSEVKVKVKVKLSVTTPNAKNSPQMSTAVYKLLLFGQQEQIRRPRRPQNHLSIWGENL